MPLLKHYGICEARTWHRENFYVYRSTSQKVQSVKAQLPAGLNPFKISGVRPEESLAQSISNHLNCKSIPLESGQLNQGKGGIYPRGGRGGSGVANILPLAGAPEQFLGWRCRKPLNKTVKHLVAIINSSEGVLCTPSHHQSPFPPWGVSQRKAASLKRLISCTAAVCKGPNPDSLYVRHYTDTDIDSPCPQNPKYTTQTEGKQAKRGKSFAQSHTASQGQRQEQNPGLPTSSAIWLLWSPTSRSFLKKELSQLVSCETWPFQS